MRYIIFIGLVLIGFLGRAQEVQWASEVLGFSSEFIYEGFPGQYLAKQILGKPSVMTRNGASACAWAPAKVSSETGEWIEVGYANPMQIQQVLVHENYNSGSVKRITVKGEGQEQQVYLADTNFYHKEAQLFSVTFDRTAFKVASVKVELNTKDVGGHNQIDAIGIADHQKEVKVSIKLNEQAANTPVELINLGSAINTSSNELCPIISPDGKTIYFTRDTNEFNIGVNSQDIWYSAISGTGYAFEKAQNIGGPINTKGNNSMLSITPDGQTAMLLNIYNEDGSNSAGVSFSQRSEGGWQFPEKLDMENYYNDNKFGEYSLSNSGKVLILAIQRKDSEGSKDLYVSFRNEDDTWTEPKSLGPTVNTAASEVSPFLAADNRTIYYGTSGLPGYGSTDIFMTRRLDDTWEKWSEPENLGPYLNTPKFDAYYSFTASGDEVYLVSYRDGGFGGSDIYRAKVPKALQPRPVTLVRGVVRNQKTDAFLSADIRYYSLTTGKQMGVAHSEPSTGQYQIVLPAGDRYGFAAGKEGFLPVSSEFELTKQDTYQEKEVNLYLVPIEKDAKIVVKNVYFDTDKSDLRDASKVELDQLAEIMLKNPSMVVEVSAHTDDVGQDEYNQTLSEKRALSVVSYLKGKGIEANKLQSRGYGETTPIAPNTNDANRQLNRRVEFKVLEI